MLWQHYSGPSCTKPWHFCVTYPATAKIAARQVARAIAESRIKFHFSCNLSRNDFGRRWVFYNVKCFAQLVPPQCRQNIARQSNRARKDNFTPGFATGKQKRSFVTVHDGNASTSSRQFCSECQILKSRNKKMRKLKGAAQILYLIQQKDGFGNLGL